MRIDLGLPLADGEIAVDARMRFRRIAVEIGQCCDAGAAAGLRRAGREDFRVEAVEADRLDATGLGHGHHFAGECVEHNKAARILEIDSHGIGGERRREEHRAIGELAPEITPDVVGQHRLRLEDAKPSMHLAGAVADRAVDLANDHRSAVAEQDFAWSQPIRAEIDETAHGAAFADSLRDGDLVEAVLRREHIAIGGQIGLQLRQRGFRRLRLHRQHDDRPFAGQFRRGKRRDYLPEGLHRAGDGKPAGAAGLHMLLNDIDHRHRQTRARPIGA